MDEIWLSFEFAITPYVSGIKILRKDFDAFFFYHDHLQGAAQELRTTRLHGSVKRTGV